MKFMKGLGMPKTRLSPNTAIGGKMGMGKIRDSVKAKLKNIVKAKLKNLK